MNNKSVWVDSKSQKKQCFLNLNCFLILILNRSLDSTSYNCLIPILAVVGLEVERRSGSQANVTNLDHYPEYGDLTNLQHQNWCYEWISIYMFQVIRILSSIFQIQLLHVDLFWTYLLLVCAARAAWHQKTSIYSVASWGQCIFVSILWSNLISNRRVRVQAFNCQTIVQKSNKRIGDEEQSNNHECEILLRNEYWWIIGGIWCAEMSPVEHWVAILPRFFCLSRANAVILGPETMT